MGIPGTDSGNLDSPRRIAVVGAVGSGKSTLARALAQHAQLPYVDLDSLRYRADWKKVADQTFFDDFVREAGMGEWVIDGNYELSRDIVWLRAEVLIWVDLPLPIVMWRLLKRTARRLITKEEFANGNRESVWRLFGPDSIVLWAIRSHKPRRSNFEGLLTSPRYAHLRVIRLRSPREMDAYLAVIESMRKQSAYESEHSGRKGDGTSRFYQRH